MSVFMKGLTETYTGTSKLMLHLRRWANRQANRAALEAAKEQVAEQMATAPEAPPVHRHRVRVSRISTYSACGYRW